MLVRRLSISALSVSVTPPTSVTTLLARWSSTSESERVTSSALLVRLAMRVSSRLAKPSPELVIRSVTSPSRWSIELKIDTPLSLMRSISVPPELVMVVDSLVEAVRMLVADDVAEAEPSSSRKRLVRAGDRGADALGVADHARRARCPGHRRAVRMRISFCA